MESFSELIKARRSMRKFTEEELTQEQVVTLMKAALMAPTSKRSNAWQFIVVDDKDTLKKLSLCKEQASQFIADAALAVVVIADPLVSDVWIEDAAIASIYLQLQAEDMGLGADLHRIHDMHQERKIIFPFRDIEVYKITSRPVVMQERTRYIFCLRNQFMRHHTFCQNLLFAANIKEITSHRQTFAVPRICHIH